MRARRAELMRDYDVMHGHFAPEKYAGLFPNARFVDFFRDPYQHAISGYHNALRRPDLDHPVVKAVNERKMTLTDSIAAFPNPQSLYMGQTASKTLRWSACKKNTNAASRFADLGRIHNEGA
jgi:hypothetical protein